MKILVTGGLGYIGSHTVIELITEGYQVVIVDNLVNSQIEMLAKIEKLAKQKIPFYQVDCTDENNLEEVFLDHQFSGIIHFAGLKAVGESVSLPLNYYYNNVTSTITLAKLAFKYRIEKFIFSSSATVYGDQKSPLIETMPQGVTTNPYGETKAISERILSDAAKINENFNVALLRYFNPIGAHKSGLIGELPTGIPNNLMPYITQTAKGIRKQLYVFGDDYDTLDGTGVRDYIHVVDLAKGHVAALKYNLSGAEIFNLGTGKGTSVFEIITAFERVNKIKIPYVVTERRAGDIAISYADPTKAQKNLNWRAELTIDDMVKDAWRFEKNLK
ncbi:MAG: UDP-glucose 4-epimerase GalE [Acholeplasmataceae bacterium]|jgi:UDP-glucose 4-epimerase|nr:UDP-glucose 4-epimerase GalE [Acholeplasmataceae bacterium]